MGLITWALELLRGIKPWLTGLASNQQLKNRSRVAFIGDLCYQEQTPGRCGLNHPIAD